MATLLLLGVLLLMPCALAQNYGSGTTSAPASLTPASFQAPNLSPQDPGSGNAKQGSSAPQAGKTSPTTQKKPSSQAKQQVYTRVPVRARL